MAESSNKLDGIIEKLQAEMNTRFEQLPIEFLPTVLGTQQMQQHVTKMIKPNLDEFRGEITTKLKQFQDRQDKLRVVSCRETIVRAN